VIRFTVVGRGPGPLTWSQLLIWRDCEWLGAESHYYNLSFVIPVASGKRLEDVLAALREIVLRHEVLRSRIRVDAHGAPTQECPSTGEMEVAVAAASDGRWPQLQADVLKRLKSRAFCFPQEWPIRFAVVSDEAGPRSVVAVLSHVAVDGGAVRLLKAQLTELIDASERAAAHPVPPQPLDRAAFEASPAGRRMSEAALAVMRRQLMAAPQTPLPIVAGQPGHPRFQRLGMRSPALTAAMRLVANRLEVSSSAVLMAGVALVLGVVGGNDRVLLKLILGNRGFPDLRDMVGVAVSNGYQLLHLGGASFNDFVRATAGGSLRTYARSQCDPADRERLIAAVGEERGVALDLSAYFNDFRQGDVQPAGVAADQLSAMRADTELEWVGGWEKQDASFFFHVLPGEEIEPVFLMVDTQLIARDQVSRLLLALETIIVRAACGDLSITDAAGVAGLAPPRREDGWAHLDHCWIRPMDVAAVVCAAVPVARAQVMVEEATDGGPRLTAYVLTDDADLTPADVHREVLAHLPGHRTAKAPDWYVLCEPAASAAADEDLTALAIRREGRGRVAGHREPAAATGR
jgi:hypothetical protein